MDYQTMPDFQKEALNFVAKSGYIRKAFFFDYLSSASVSSKYKNWGRLIESGLLDSYKSTFYGEDTYKLSKRGKRILANYGIEPVSAAYPNQFDHDDAALKFALSNQKVGIINSDWQGDRSLRAKPSDDLKSIFGSANYKLPDLLFSISGLSEKLTGVLEIERTRKTESKYLDFISAYKDADNISLILIAYNHNSVKVNLEKAINRRLFPIDDKPIGFCKLIDMIADPVNFEIEFGDYKIQFSKYINKLRNLEAKEQSNNMDGAKSTQDSLGVPQ
ncbi:MAG: hypothetical protein BroJett040_23440 [Oligoflexia bacterium]|nr:MAG: hypothetical protein BroJett040_23440 [Oligoflexia bacterium]